jgi:hypothetical protein
MDDIAHWLLIATVLALLLFLTIAVTPIAVVGIIGYVGYRLYNESPARREARARADTLALYHAAKAGSVLFSDDEIDTAISAAWPSNTPETLRLQLLQIGRTLFESEGLSPEIPDMPPIHNSVEAARYRDHLERIGTARRDKGMAEDALATISASLAPLAHAVPQMDGTVLVDVRQFMDPLGEAVQAVMAPYFADRRYDLFKDLKDRLEMNLGATHRTPPVLPKDYKGDDVVEVYLRGTPLFDLFSLKTPFAIPEKVRFEHSHIVAGSGHGKTQTLQYMIANDLSDVLHGDKSVVVIDSQGDLIKNILASDHVPPDKIVLIDPEDIEYPVALNLFSVGQERLAEYSALDRERLSNSIIELYDFVLGSLLASGMTAKQSVLFRYVTRLLFHIPNATIHTLREMMEPNGSEQYAEHIGKLEGTARRFFETEFESKEFAATKTQVLRRLYGILENQTFERMFSDPQSKLDMFTELNAGKLILINTAKSLLKENGTEIFGRFFIALIAQAAQERATIPKQDRTPAIVYIDEAQDYFDPTVGVILSQARKYNVGMVIAHQYLGQLSGGLVDAVEANTPIKMAGGVSAKDARALAGQMNADAGTIQRQPKGSFATYIRGYTQKAVSMAFPFFVLERMPKRDKEGCDAIVQHSRDAYARAWQQEPEHSEPELSTDEAEPEEKPPSDPTEPSPEL